MVGAQRFELWTASWSRTRRSYQAEPRPERLLIIALRFRMFS